MEIMNLHKNIKNAIILGKKQDKTLYHAVTRQLRKHMFIEKGKLIYLSMLQNNG